MKRRGFFGACAAIALAPVAARAEPARSVGLWQYVGDVHRPAAFQEIVRQHLAEADAAGYILPDWIIEVEEPTPQQMADREIRFTATLTGEIKTIDVSGGLVL